MRLSEYVIYEKLRDCYLEDREWFVKSEIILAPDELRFFAFAVRRGAIEIQKDGIFMFRFCKYFNRMHKQYSREPIPEHRLALSHKQPKMRYV